MADNRVRVAHGGKPINLAQLDQESGGHGLCSDDADVVAVEGSPVTAMQLSDAIAAHIAIDEAAAKQAAKASALAKLQALGLTEQEAAAIAGL